MFNTNYVFMFIIITLLIILLSLLFTFIYAKHIFKGIKYWVLGSVFYFSSIAIYLYDFTENDLIQFALGNTAIAIGLMYFTHATNSMLDRKESIKQFGFIYLIVFAFLCFFKFIYDDVSVRQFLMSVYIIYVMVMLFIPAFSYFRKPGYRFFITHVILSAGIIVLHLVRIMFIVYGIDKKIVSGINMTYDAIILYLVTAFVVQAIVVMTIYINVNSVIMLRKERHNLELASMSDFLTQLPNRRMLQSYLNNLISKNKRFALVITDVDGFKQINDKYGHDIGDLVIKEYAQILNSHKRDQDFIARYGGDEFIIVIDDYQATETLQNALNEKIMKLCEVIEVASIHFVIKASVGIALFPTDGLTSNELFKKADAALYYAKSTGKNKIAFYHDLNETSL